MNRKCLNYLQEAVDLDKNGGIDGRCMIPKESGQTHVNHKCTCKYKIVKDYL